MDEGMTFTGACCLTIGKVSIHSDGTVTIQEGATLSDAAISFWDAVNKAWPKQSQLDHTKCGARFGEFTWYCSDNCPKNTPIKNWEKNK